MTSFRRSGTRIRRVRPERTTNRRDENVLFRSHHEVRQRLDGVHSAIHADDVKLNPVDLGGKQRDDQSHDEDPAQQRQGSAAVGPRGNMSRHDTERIEADRPYPNQTGRSTSHRGNHHDRPRDRAATAGEVDCGWAVRIFAVVAR